MKLLLDANISWKLVNPLKEFFEDCSHVDFIGLDVPADDNEIWDYALRNDFIIITKDNDFLNILEMNGHPPKIVLLKTGNNSSRALLELIKKIKPLIDELLKSKNGVLQII